MHSGRRFIFAAAAFALSIGAAQAAPEPKAVAEAYADLAEAMFTDAQSAARELQTAIDAFLGDPTEEKLAAARQAWKAARVPYQQTEGYRFGNPAVDEWEGKVNAWPLDEGLIDYVDVSIYGETSDENPLYRADIIANERVRIGKDQIDVSKITKPLLSETLHEAAGIEANVASGYHAIEFLLWGQDLNGTEPGAGRRPATDYSATACTNDHCDRRRDYLKAVTGLLVDDLGTMVAAWGKDGAARKDVLGKNGDAALATILTGLGSLSYGELAGERMKLGLMLHDPEEEHDCFSDNTHNSHYYDQVGMIAIWNGRYKRLDGSAFEGASLAALAAGTAPDEAAKVDAAMKTALEKLDAIRERAESGAESYDQMLAEGNAEGNQRIQDAVDALVVQTRAIEAVVAKLGLNISVEGSDSLDNPASVK